MHKNNNIIHINGQAYDAKTGHPLGSAKTGRQIIKPRSVDGVHKPDRPIAHHKQAQAKHPRTAPKPSHHHKPQHSKTLMRHTVKRPSIKAASIRTNSSISYMPADINLGQVVVNKSVDRLDSQRLKHAKRVSKSKLISRFAPLTNRPFEPVIPAPGQASDKTPKPNAQPGRHANPAHRPSHPSHTARHAAARHSTEALIKRGLERADSHKQRPFKSTGRWRRVAGFSGAAVLAIAVLGVIMAQNLPNAKMELASAKAGFSASLPNYRPAGYSLNQLNSSPGVVAVQFNSNSDDRAYTITQKQSDWDSAALRDNFVIGIDPHYQAIESAGLTIYIYGQNNATWVNNGIWYQVQSNGSLSNRQLINLASSL